MKRICWIGLLGLLGFCACVGRVSADVAPFPAGQVDLDFVLTNLDEFPKYDFYLKYGVGRNPARYWFHLTRVEAGKVTALEGTGGRHTDIFLVALPRGQAPPALPENMNPSGPWLKTAPADG